MFDESLNTVTKRKQMDIHIRSWTDGQVMSTYLTSQFMGHTSTTLGQHWKAEYAENAEKTHQLTWLSKSNSLRKSAKEKTAELKAVDELLDEKLLQLKNC